MSAIAAPTPAHPQDTLSGFEEWEHFVEERYPTPLEGQIGPPPMQRTMQRRDGYRDYRAEARPGVKEFYRLNHIHQTMDLVKAKQQDFGRLNRKEMSVWEAIELLDTIVDDSDPDNENSQIWHALQSGEAAREAGGGPASGARRRTAASSTSFIGGAAGPAPPIFWPPPPG